MKIKNGVLVKIKKRDIKNGTIQIPSKVTSIAAGAFIGCEDITSIEIPSSVTSIEEGAFLGCSRLTSVEIPSILVENDRISRYFNTESLKNVEVQEGTRSICKDAFEGCKSLTSIEIPSSVTNIEYGAFKECDSLEDIKIPPTLVENDNLQRWFDTNILKNIEIQEGTANISSYAFSGCSNLTNIKIPSSVTSIGQYAFYGCSNLTSIEIPSSVTSIGYKAFEKCDSLEKIKVPLTLVENGRLYDHFNKDFLKTVIIQEGSTSIGERAFLGCSSLTSIEIPSSVTSIGDYAFCECSGLASIEIPSSVTSIGEDAFYGCRSLTSIEIPSSVTSIGEEAFLTCSSLESIKIPSSVTSIGKRAFMECSSLTNIEIPSSVTSIEGGAFQGCSGLTSIEIPEGVTSIGESAFNGCSGLTSIEIPSSVTSIEYYAFRRCSGLTSIKILDSLKIIENNAFVNCENVKNVEGEYIKGREKEIYFTHFQNAENLYPYLYGEDAERFAKLREKTAIETSTDYNQQILAELYYNMYKTIGIDAMERMLDISQIDEKDLSRYYSDTDEVYQKYFKRTYRLGGELGETALLLQNIETYVNNKKDKQNVFSALNQGLEDKEIFTVEDLWKKVEEKMEVNPEIKTKILLKSQEINGRKIEENLVRAEEKIESIFEDFNLDDTTKRFSKRLIIEKITEEYIANGKTTLEHVLEGIETAQINVPAISAQRETFKEIATSIFNNSGDILNYNIIDELRSTKERVGTGWIRKLLQINPNIKEEELESIVAKINSPNITREDLIKESKVSVDIVPGVDKTEIYRELEGKQIKGIVTYNQIEQMFGEIREPYSDEFKKWFQLHQEEIMDNPEYYLSFSKMHNNFESIINRPEIRRRYEEEGISVERLHNIISELKHYGERSGEEELGDKFDLAGVDPTYYTHAQKLYEQMRKRENTQIPQIEQVNGEKYRGRILRMDDPNVMFVGNNTTCCQKFNDVGEAAMLDSAQRDGVFVVERLEEDGTCTLIGQSWIWRNKDRVCFDNIELPHSLEDSMTEDEYSDFIQVYQKAAEDMISLDEKFLRKQYEEGKITKETYEQYRISEVTVGMGYINNGILRSAIEEVSRGKAEIILPENINDPHHGGVQSRSSGYSDAKDTQHILAQTSRKKEREKFAETTEKSNIWYGNQDEVETLRGKDIRWRVEQIKEIEKIAFKEERQMLQECETKEDIAGVYNLDVENMTVLTNRDKSWYMIYEERDEELYIADLAMLNGTRSENKGTTKSNFRLSTGEIAVYTYELMIEMAKKR